MNNKLGPYNLIGTIGRGGMGVVYKGYETSLNRFVAVKMLADALVDDAGVRERFVREARSMAALNDPHIIQIYSVGEDQGCPYFIMEFVDGESLSSLLAREGRLHAEQAAKVIHQTALGLAVAHDKGVIHRDIKPGNLMITSRGGVKIADFGIALSHQDLSRKLTSSGEFVGTPGYLSPEVCLAKPVDQRSDIFALGIVLFEMLTGKMPFTDVSPLGLMLEVVKADIPDVRALNAEVDPELSRILGKMIAKDPAARYQSCHELATDLEKHPLVAKGGALGLKPVALPLSPIRRNTAAGVAAAAPAAALANAADTPTARRTNRLAASNPMVKRSPVVAAASPRAGRYWAAAAAATVLVAASAWGLRDDLPLPASLRSNPVQTDAATTGASAPAAMLATTTTAMPGSGSSPATAAVTGNGIAASGRANDAGDPDAALMDASWLADVPEEALEPDSGGDGAPAGYAGDYSPAYRGPEAYTYPAYTYAPAPLLLPASVAYYAPAPWHFSVGFGIGIGYWASRVIAPYPFYRGPVLQQPGVAWYRPQLPGATVAATSFGGRPNFANTPMPGAAVATAMAARATDASAPLASRSLASIPHAQAAAANTFSTAHTMATTGAAQAEHAQVSPGSSRASPVPVQSGFVHNPQSAPNFRPQSQTFARNPAGAGPRANPNAAARNAQLLALRNQRLAAQAQARSERRAELAQQRAVKRANAAHPLHPAVQKRHPRQA